HGESPYDAAARLCKSRLTPLSDFIQVEATSFEAKEEEDISKRTGLPSRYLRSIFRGHMSPLVPWGDYMQFIPSRSSSTMRLTSKQSSLARRFLRAHPLSPALCPDLFALKQDLESPEITLYAWMPAWEFEYLRYTAQGEALVDYWVQHGDYSVLHTDGSAQRCFTPVTARPRAVKQTATNRRLEEKLYTSRLTAIYAKHMLLRSYMDTYDNVIYGGKCAGYLCGSSAVGEENATRTYNRVSVLNPEQHWTKVSRKKGMLCFFAPMGLTGQRSWSSTRHKLKLKTVCRSQKDARASLKQSSLAMASKCSAPSKTPCARFVEAKFMGLHKKGFVRQGDWHPVTLWPPLSFSSVWQTGRYFANLVRPSVAVKVFNAREQEAMEGLSKREFFEKYGFVLLRRPTNMQAEDWTNCAPKTLDLSNFTGMGMPKIETAISRIYAKEVEEMVRELMPAATFVELDPLCARRGPGTKNPTYSFAVHQDYGYTADDWPLADNGFKARFDEPNVTGFMAVNFWRPVLPMKGPVKKAPLAVCDPRSVKMEDTVPINIRWDELGYVKMLALAHDGDQRWYYYPDMTVDEVLVFKSFQYFKRQEGRPELNTCFHTAFEDPTAPPNAEPRQSAEYRVRVWF
ncbi:aclN, partial [Symbiodinium microadriaticum]